MKTIEDCLKIPNQYLSLPSNCSSPEVVAVSYLLRPKVSIEDAQIFDVRCQRAQCPIEDCQYKKIVPFQRK